MTLFRMLAALATFFAAGFGLTVLLSSRTCVFSRWEIAAFSWLLGTGAVSILIWLLGLIISGPILIAAVTVISLALAAAGVMRRPHFEPIPKWRMHDWLLAMVFLAQAIFIGWWAPQLTIGWDGLLIWELKARLAFDNGGAVPASYFSDPNRVWSHPNYPLYFPHTQAWLYLCLGRADEAWVRVLGPMYYGAAAVLLAIGTRRLGGSPVIGKLAAALLFFVPYCVAGTWSIFSGYADFPLAVLYLGALIVCPFWRKGDERLFAVLAGLLVFAKNEGRFLWFALLLVAALALFPRRQRRAWLLLTLPGAALLVGFWIYLQAVNCVPNVHFHSPSFSVLNANAHRLPAILSRVISEFTNLEHWSLLWVGGAAAWLSLIIRKQPMPALAVAITILVPLGAYIGAFLLTSYTRWTMDTSMPRLVFQLAPVALLTIALAVPPRLLLATSPPREDNA